MKRVELANGDKVDLFYSFRTSKEMLYFKKDMKELESLHEKYGADVTFEDLEDEDLQIYLSSISKITVAVLRGSRYDCDLEEIDFLLNEDVIKAVVELLEAQKKKEESLQTKKKISQPSRKR